MVGMAICGLIPLYDPEEAARTLCCVMGGVDVHRVLIVVCALPALRRRARWPTSSFTIPKVRFHVASTHQAEPTRLVSDFSVEGRNLKRPMI